MLTIPVSNFSFKLGIVVSSARANSPIQLKFATVCRAVSPLFRIAASLTIFFKDAIWTLFGLLNQYINGLQALISSRIYSMTIDQFVEKWFRDIYLSNDTDSVLTTYISLTWAQSLFFNRTKYLCPFICTYVINETPAKISPWLSLLDTFQNTAFC